MADDNGGEVVIRLSQEGGEEIVAKLQEIIAKLAEVGEQSKKTSENTEKIGEGVKGIGSAAGITALATGATAVMELGEKAWEAARKVGELASRFIEAAAHDEQLTLQVASLTESIEGFDASLEHAKQTMVGLKDLKILGDEDQLASTFRRLTLLVGGTSQSITDLTNRMGLFAQQNGVTTESLLRVIQMAERTGTLPMRGNMAFASMALQRAGISGQDIQQAGAAITGGDNEAMDKLLQKIQTSKEATDALEGSWRNLGAQYDRAKGEIEDMIAEGFEPLKDVVKDIIELLKSDEVREAVASFTDALKGGLKSTINETGSLIAHLTELVSYFGQSWGIAKRYMYATSWQDVKEANAASGELSAQHERNLAELGMKYHPDRGSYTVGTGAEATWPEVDEDAAAMAAGNYIGHHEKASPGPTAPIGPDTARQIEAAREQFEQFKQGLQQKLDVSGLDGVAKALASIDAEAKGSYEALDREEEKLRKLGKPVSKDEDFGVRATIWEQQHRAAAEAIGQAWEKEEKQRESTAFAVEQTIRNARQKSTLDVIEQIEQQAVAEQDANEKRVENLKESLDRGYKDQIQLIDAFAKEGWITEKDADDERVKAYQEMTDKKAALDRASVVFNAASEREKTDKQAMILDVQYGHYEDYYNRLMKKSQDTHQNEFVAAQENARQVASLMEKQAVTLEDGIAAAAAKIRAGMTSFGQDVAKTFESIWGAVTKSFEDGFYDILTGKFDSLKDVLKSLWDSILKDFSKMLAQMLERWLLTGEAMGSGQGGGGFGSLLSGLFGGGSSAVYTPGGTQANAPGGGFTQYGDYVGTTGYGQGGQGFGGSGASAKTMGGIAAAAQIGYGLYQNYQDSRHTVETPTYNGVSLGQQDFGGNASFGKDFTPFATAAVTLAATGYGIIAAVIVAAVGLIVAGLNSLFNGPKEGEVMISVRDAWLKGASSSGLGQFTKQVLDSSVNFLVGLMVEGGKGSDAATGAAGYQSRLREFFGSTYFKLSAGSGEDLSADVKAFYEKQFPKMALQVGFGQFGDKYGWPTGNRDAGGFAGMDWNVDAAGHSTYMDKDGRWLKQQLYDPEAPIPAFLAGIGFSQGKIAEIATKLAGSGDIEKFKTYLNDLVGVVVAFGDLAKQFGRSRDDWYAFIQKSQNEKGTAAQFTEQITALKATGIELDNMTGDDRVAKAKELVTASGNLLNNMAQALASIYNMIEAIQQSTKDTIASYKSKLMTPAEREAQARADYATDVTKIATAANPEAVQKAWQQVMKDLSAVLDAIVARIQSIKALQQSYADFRTQMAKDAGPQFDTDPGAWLAQNQREIDVVTTTLKTATGDEAIQGAQKLLDLTRERYNNEVAQLAKINGMIQSISEQGQTTSDNLRMQGMGSVVNGKWVPDTHAQGDFLKSQYDDLMGQLATAKTPEEVQKIYNKMQGIISQLAAQPQDPEHYAESRSILASMNDKATKAATDLLKKWGKDLDTDIAGTGDKLAAGEVALAKALKLAEKDFDDNIKLMSDASALATDALNVFADGLIAAMQNLSKAITHWNWVMTHPDSEKDPNWDYEKNTPSGGYTAPPETDTWEDDPTDEDYQICVSGPNKGKRRRKPGHHPKDEPSQNPATSTTAPAGANSTTSTRPATADQLTKAMEDLAKTAANKTITVNVSGGTPEEIAEAVKEQVLATVRANNVEIVRVIRNNPSLISSAV